MKVSPEDLCLDCVILEARRFLPLRHTLHGYYFFQDRAGVYKPCDACFNKGLVDEFNKASI